jgi:hypothetical protein
MEEKRRSQWTGVLDTEGIDMVGQWRELFTETKKKYPDGLREALDKVLTSTGWCTAMILSFPLP